MPQRQAPHLYTTPVHSGIVDLHVWKLAQDTKFIILNLLTQLFIVRIEVLIGECVTHCR